MANLQYNLDDNTFLKNRLQYHAASRVGISINEALTQATNVDGHTVTDAQVWTSVNADFPKNTGDNKTTSDGIAATNDLVTVFKTQVGDSIVSSESLNGGTVWTNTAYPAVKLFEKVEMSSIANSDDQSWEVRGTNGRFMDWVAPTSVKDNGLPVPGFSGIIEANTDSGSESNWTILQKSSALSYGWELKKGTWEFVYLPGMLLFHPDYIPSKMGYTKIRITAFQYVGSYLTQTIEGINDKIQSGVSDGINKTLAIKPYVFNLSKMTNEEGKYFIDIPGFVINVEDDTGATIGDWERLDNGDTKITFSLDEDELLAISSSTFTAYAFVNKDGTKINMLDSTTL